MLSLSILLCRSQVHQIFEFIEWFLEILRDYLALFSRCSIFLGPPGCQILLWKWSEHSYIIAPIHLTNSGLTLFCLLLFQEGASSSAGYLLLPEHVPAAGGGGPRRQQPLGPGTNFITHFTTITYERSRISCTSSWSHDHILCASFSTSSFPNNNNLR
jgi:hypothetical protein